MKRIFAVVIWLFGIYLTDVYAEVTESNPIQKYVKKGHESVLQCIYEDSTLIWSVKNKDSRKTIASGDAVTNSTRYKVSTNPTTNLYYRLHVLNAQPDDELIYRCETGNLRYYIQLTLYLPPTGLYFYGSANNITLEGTEGKDLLIRCIAVGGNPQPYVSILYGTRPNKTQQVSYTIPTISRDKHQGLIKCQATSNALDNPMTATVQIYLNLSPLKPILNTNEINTEETVPLTVSCTSYGSRPAATFTWTIGGNNVTSNSSTSPPFKESNDTYTVTSTLIFSVNKTHNKQKIICQASNTEGSVRAGNTLDVKYAPDITVNSPTYTQNDAIRTVTCNPSGNPDNYTYNKWQHKSKYGDLIREFDGNKTLKLPDAPVILRYQDSGEYVCTASNGIKNKDNKFEQSGSKYVTINAQPAFTSDTIGRVKQFGELNKAVDMYVNVYSVPKFTSNIWTRDGTQITTQNTASFPTVVKDEIYGTEVQMDGYNVTLTIRDLKVADFANYTVTLKNEFGTVKYTIILESASRPEIPGNFSNIASSSTSITVQWDPNSGGGYKQTFYLEYRVQGSIDWITEKTGEEDINESKSRRRYELRNLLAGKTYELRMFAENTAEKRSNVTEVLVAFTESSGSGPSVAAIIGGIAGGLTAIIIVLLVICFVQKKRKDNGTPSTKLRASSKEEEDGLKDNILYESSQSDGLKKNILYQSSGPDSQKKPSTSSEYAEVQKPNAIYAEVNKVAQPKNAKEKKQKDKKGKPKKARKVKDTAFNNNPNDEYANAALQLQNLNDGEYANSTDTQGPFSHHTNAQGLEYADLTFGQIPAKNKKQVIHGNDERTIYADVDHTKKAPPPPTESEYEETNIKHGKMA